MEKQNGKIRQGVVKALGVCDVFSVKGMPSTCYGMLLSERNFIFGGTSCFSCTRVP
jgi:hypothetical protein